MDGNKDDALKSFKIGKEALQNGDRNRALKFLNKARRLDPALPVDDLLSTIQTDEGDPPPPVAAPSDQPSIRRRSSAPAPAPGPSTTSSISYSQEQISIIREIKRKKNYYDILGLEKSCTVDDVRKSYRKLSLKVHPDKNKAPGAEDAFKLVSKAFQCLGNEESKRKYDVSGEDEVVYERRTARPASARGFNGYYDADVDAEEIFRNFFFGGMAPAANFGGFSFGGPGMAHRQPAADNRSGGFNVRALIQRRQWGYIRETPHCDMLRKYDSVR
ncbi:hypothetical protein KIW84_010674 [Lathyrus oleraceus]|uniref:J domain-containing protein n=1 Tax=Pisum sativum TaxID=3888 RepID=A0A9D4YLW2_PEA|nr:hypothetical protein KIW84_010674 [Pisum sativum]